MKAKATITSNAKEHTRKNTKVCNTAHSNRSKSTGYNKNEDMFAFQNEAKSNISRISDTFEDTNEAKSTDEKITGIESVSSHKFVGNCREFDLAKFLDTLLE